ncbi:MAG: FAD-dependent monooxygenase, partial [Ilumatobacteraceae bacterium]
DYVFYQPDLDGLLRRGLTRFDVVTTRFGDPAPSLDDLLEQSRFVVGCDGASSPVRQRLGVALDDLGYDEAWLVVDVLADHVPRAHGRLIQQVCDPDRPTTYVPSHGRHHRWEFKLTARDEAPDAWRLLHPWSITPRTAELIRAVPYRFHALVADRWRGGPDGRVVLAGDAAHQMPPFMGQGMCTGLRDAADLAWRLDEALSSSSDVDAHLTAYECERSTHTRQIVELSIESGRLIDRIAADLAAGRTVDRPAPDVAGRWRWSRLPGLDLDGDFPVGHQVPQPTVDGQPLDDLLGDGWAWVAADDAFVAPDGRRVVVAPAATMDARALLVRPDRYVTRAVHEQGRSAVSYEGRT